MHRPGIHLSIGRLAIHLVSLLVASCLAVPTQVSALPDWAWPVREPHIVIREWQQPVDAYSPGHRGIDIKAAAGDIVVAPESGTVHFAGHVVDRSVLSIAHPGDLVSSYEPLETTLKKGDHVTRGQQIGTVASSDHCTESCLHFGVRNAGQYTSPRLLLEARPRAILLPVSAAGVGGVGGVERRMLRVRPAGAPDGRSRAASPSSHECRSGSCRGSRDRASPAPRAGRHRRRADGWPPCV